MHIYNMVTLAVGADCCANSDVTSINNQQCAIVACNTGSIFASVWGVCGFFGPLTVHPDFWNHGVATALLEPTFQQFKARGVMHVELYTFATSIKHHHLYQKFGMFPSCLTYIMALELAAASEAAASSAGSAAAQVAAAETSGRYSLTLLGGQSDDGQATTMTSIPELLGKAAMPGLDINTEIQAVQAGHANGQVLLVHDQGSALAAVAVVHIGSGSEAGSGCAFVKVAVASDADSFGYLLQQVRAQAAEAGCQKVEAGVNLMRKQAHDVMRGLGFKATSAGLSMQGPSIQELSAASSSLTSSSAAAGAGTSVAGLPVTYNRHDCFMTCDMR